MNEVFFLKDHIHHLDSFCSVMYAKGSIVELEGHVAARLVAVGVATFTAIAEDDLMDGRWSDHLADEDQE